MLFSPLNKADLSFLLLWIEVWVLATVAGALLAEEAVSFGSAVTCVPELQIRPWLACLATGRRGGGQSEMAEWSFLTCQSRRSSPSTISTDERRRSLQGGRRVVFSSEKLRRLLQSDGWTVSPASSSFPLVEWRPTNTSRLVARREAVSASGREPWLWSWQLRRPQLQVVLSPETARRIPLGVKGPDCVFSFLPDVLSAKVQGLMCNF